MHHGFPNKPTALAWDPELRIAAVGTATGAVKMYVIDWFWCSYKIREDSFAIYSSNSYYSFYLMWPVSIGWVKLRGKAESAPWIQLNLNKCSCLVCDKMKVVAFICFGITRNQVHTLEIILNTLTFSRIFPSAVSLLFKNVLNLSWSVSRRSHRRSISRKFVGYLISDQNRAIRIS